MRGRIGAGTRLTAPLARPHSAVSAGVGLAGCAVLAAWVLVCRQWGAVAAAFGFAHAPAVAAGPAAALVGMVLVAAAMAGWSLAVDRVHRRESAGLSAAPVRAWRDSLPISATKLLALAATGVLVAFAYGVCRWCWAPPWDYAMGVIFGVAPWLVVPGAVYVVWLDRRLAAPRDGCWALGRWLLSQPGGVDVAPVGVDAAPVGDAAAIAGYLRAWLVKAFFGAFMLSILPGTFAAVVTDRFAMAPVAPADMADALIDVCFLFDVMIGLVGYVLTLRVLDAQIRSAQPRLDGWVAALICYPPFVLMGDGGPLDYRRGTAPWSDWLARLCPAAPTLGWVWAAWLVALTAVYAAATVAFGPRFSNLTRRGTITHGPYRLCRHPAYLAKNLFWWSTTLPFLALGGSWVDAVRNTTLLAVVSGVYWWRARTEEAHLLAEDADYRAYHAWAGAHAPVTRALAAAARWLRGQSVFKSGGIT